MKISEEEIYQKLIDRGLSPIQAAGLLGNLKIESGFNTSISNPKSGNFGLAQWGGARLRDLKYFADLNNVSIDDPDFQLDFLINELNTTHQDAGKLLANAQTPQEAAKVILYHYEKPSEQEIADTISHRIGYANHVAKVVLNNSGEGSGGGGSGGTTESSEVSPILKEMDTAYESALQENPELTKEDFKKTDTFKTILNKYQTSNTSTNNTSTKVPSKSAEKSPILKEMDTAYESALQENPELTKEEFKKTDAFKTILNKYQTPTTNTDTSTNNTSTKVPSKKEEAKGDSFSIKTLGKSVGSAALEATGVDKIINLNPGEDISSDQTSEVTNFGKGIYEALPYATADLADTVVTAPSKIRDLVDVVKNDGLYTPEEGVMNDLFAALVPSKGADLVNLESDIDELRKKIKNTTITQANLGEVNVLRDKLTNLEIKRDALAAEVKNNPETSKETGATAPFRKVLEKTGLYKDKSDIKEDTEQAGYAVGEYIPSLISGGATALPRSALAAGVGEGVSAMSDNPLLGAAANIAVSFGAHKPISQSLKKTKNAVAIPITEKGAIKLADNKIQSTERQINKLRKQGKTDQEIASVIQPRNKISGEVNSLARGLISESPLLLYNVAGLLGVKVGQRLSEVFKKHLSEKETAFINKFNENKNNLLAGKLAHNPVKENKLFLPSSLIPLNNTDSKEEK